MMRRKVLLGLFSVVLLFTITGCGNNNNVQTKDKGGPNTTSSNLDKEGIVEKLHYKYSSDAEIDDLQNGKRMQYEKYSIIVNYSKEKNIETLVKEKKLTYNSSKKINSIKWKTYDFKENVISIIYLYEKDGGTYNVTFAHDLDVDVNLDNVIKDFMNNISFD